MQWMKGREEMFYFLLSFASSSKFCTFYFLYYFYKAFHSKDLHPTYTLLHSSSNLYLPAWKCNKSILSTDVQMKCCELKQ